MFSGKTPKLLSTMTVFLYVVSTTYAQEIFRVIRGAISLDGKYLFFKKGCRGPLDIAHSHTNRDIWWVDIQIIETLRTKEYK